VLGVLPGVIGTIQATEAIKLLAGIGEPLVGKLLLYDALRMRFRQITLPRDSECPVCGANPTIRELVEYDLSCELAEPEEPAEPGEPEEPEEPDSMTVDELQQWRAEKRPHLLIDVREPSEHAAASIEGALLIPLRELQSNVKRLPKDQPIVVHCQSGGRSAIAVGMLKLQGFDARNLSGGIRAWNRLKGAH
jgi:rhodanese-related sulfurtransferase